jgi:hypothetical protein
VASAARGWAGKGTVWRRVGAGALAWLGGIGVAAAVAHPESCPTPTADEARAAAAAGVGWLIANQADDGQFRYRVDRSGEEEVAGYNKVRHAGAALALAQAAREDFPGAAEAADAAIAWAIRRVHHLPDDRAAFDIETGGSALLAAALVERREVTGDRTHDVLLGQLGRFLVSALTEDGAVDAQWDIVADEPVAGTRSPFYTGETMWALARLHVTFPDEGWDDAARKVSHYLSNERDDAERRLPPVSDHWGSYAFDEIAAWPAPLDEDEIAYAERQVGLLGLQVRFESQRRSSGVASVTRGHFALPSGVGTLGEGLGGMWRLAGDEEGFDVDRELVAQRLACVAGMIVDRQAHTDDPLTDGAWFRRDGITQIDDQQHSISALLAALPVLAP